MRPVKTKNTCDKYAYIKEILKEISNAIDKLNIPDEILLEITNNLNNEILIHKKQQELDLNNLKNRKNKLIQQKENILTYLMNGTILEEIYKIKELQIV